MRFREFEEGVREAISDALKRISEPGVPVTLMAPADPAHGDLSCAVALRLAKTLGRSPAEVAEELAGLINNRAAAKYVASAEAHKTGYLNFRIDWKVFARDVLKEVLESSELGGLEVGKGKKVSVEHTNVNPNKALHVGHARNLVLGDAIVRVLKKLGYAVETLNYVDDSGAQVADVIVGFRFLGLKDVPPNGVKFDAYCGDSVYIKVNQEYERDPSLRDKQRFVLQEIERGTGEIAEYTRSIVVRILKEQLNTCWRLGTRYDLLNWESHILASGMWNAVFDKLKVTGLAKLETEGENKGCWVLTAEGTGEQKVLVRSDGTAVYVAKDIPYAAWKVGLLPDPFEYDSFATQPDGSMLWTTSLAHGNPQHPHFGDSDLAVSVIDVRQTRLQDIVSKVLEALEGSKAARKYVHRGYEVVALSAKSAGSLGIQTNRDFVHMAGRKGLYINVDTVLDVLKAKATEETRKRNPSAEGEWVDHVAEQVTLAAFRFELLKQDTDKIIIFDIEESLKLEGETGPYLQYSYVRARRILEKSGEGPSRELTGAALLADPKEKELIKRISVFDKVIMDAGEFLSPKEVARYAFSLASVFNEFYEAVPVNNEKNPLLRTARLAMVDAFSRVLKESLSLLGIPCPERL